jgi:hypothetical protein
LIKSFFSHSISFIFVINYSVWGLASVLSPEWWITQKRIYGFLRPGSLFFARPFCNFMQKGLAKNRQIEHPSFLPMDEHSEKLKKLIVFRAFQSTYPQAP